MGARRNLYRGAPEQERREDRGAVGCWERCLPPPGEGPTKFLIFFIWKSCIFVNPGVLNLKYSIFKFFVMMSIVEFGNLRPHRS